MRGKLRSLSSTPSNPHFGNCGPRSAGQNTPALDTTGGRGIPGISVYGAAKAGIAAWTHVLAAEVAQFGIIVNGIAPGLGDTELTKNALPGFKEPNIQRSMLKRLCRPEDVGPAVAFLASDVCSYMAWQFIELSTF
jgi:NAD(P)-dependent dehydrogenase (short-subunit alcohol dehydrogenase family)